MRHGSNVDRLLTMCQPPRWAPVMLLAVLAAAVGQTGADEPAAVTLDELLRPIPALEPDEAARSFEILGGFEMQLVAAEPAVTDPVAAAFDEDGLLYVAEMIDYPYPPAEGETPLGQIRILEDTDGDGRFERSEVFASELLWPTGVAPWQGGVFVAAAPDIWYLKDTDGDRRADVRERVFSGFGTQNEQGTVNNLTWGPGNRLYGSASTNGGQLEIDGKRVALDGQDFCFDPRTRRLELISGRGQFGCAFDDWGRRYVCTESKPLYHVVLPRRYLARNPDLAVAGVLADLAPGVTPVYRISPIEPWRAIRSQRREQVGERAATAAGASHEVIDAAAGLTIYRGEAFPAEYRGNFLVGCSQTNLIHRRILEPAGVTFTSRRAEEGTELVRSRDTWFRPVNLVHAPDGTLLVLDMSREVIEAIHIPLDVVARLDLTSGRDRGRIYRLAPAGFHLPIGPRLSNATTAELVALLAHRGGWWRDTATRLLYERQDATAVGPLRTLLREASLPQAKLHALWALDGLQALADDDLLAASADETPAVREQSVAMSEPRLAAVAVLRDRVLELADDADPRVRMQVAFTLGEFADPRVARRLATIARRDADDPWIRTAILSSLATGAGEFVVEVLAGEGEVPSGLSETVRLAAEFVARQNTPEELINVLTAMDNAQALQPVLVGASWQGLAARLRRAGHTWASWPLTEHPRLQSYLNQTLTSAGERVHDSQTTVSTRREALAVVLTAGRDVARPALLALLEQASEPELQSAAARGLMGDAAPEVAPRLLAVWQQAGPLLRGELAAALCSTAPGAQCLLEAIEQQQVPATICGTAERAALENHQDPEIAQRARVIFAVQQAERGEVIERYRGALSLSGNAERGRTVYERECQACHRLGDRGHDIGPNLALTRNRTAEALLVHVLDPNRDVPPQYVQYLAIDDQGRTWSGLLVAETPTSIALATEQGRREILLRAEIDELASTGKSLMPEGLERTIDVPAMADLLAFLLATQYDIGTEPGQIPRPEPSFSEKAKSSPATNVEPAFDRAGLRREIEAALATELLDPGQPLAEARAFLGACVAPLPARDTGEAWQDFARELRKKVLDQVVFRGTAAAWRDAPWHDHRLEPRLRGPDYTITRLRFEVIPGLWVPALLYAPDKTTGRVPAVLNLNGHEPDGMAMPFKQIRLINLAQRGMVALTVEWFGMGQLRTPGLSHDRLNQLDLCGTSGFALFYLAMTRALDLLEQDEQVDPPRIAVTGLSGGGLQTAFLMGLDERVAAANPVAGFADQRTALWSNDLGDSEHVPSDLAAICDFKHLLAMRAPRWTLLTYNARDDCCFRPAQVLPELLAAARPVYRLFGAENRLRTHVNVVPGTHNYERENREALYGFLAAAFDLTGAAADPREHDVADKVRPLEDLLVELPEDNLEFNRLARESAKALPKTPARPSDTEGIVRWQSALREKLVGLMRMPRETATRAVSLTNDHGALRIALERIAIGASWTVPAVTMSLRDAMPQRTALVVADRGRSSQIEQIERLLLAGWRVVAIDPFLWGESNIVGGDDASLFALHAMGVGQRPLGIQAGQIASITRLLIKAGQGPVTIMADGPRASLAALACGALEADVAGVELSGSLASLKQLLADDVPVGQFPEAFAFGLLERFDVVTIAQLVAPRPVTFVAATPEHRQELADLVGCYKLLGIEHAPLGDPPAGSNEEEEQP